MPALRRPHDHARRRPSPGRRAVRLGLGLSLLLPLALAACSIDVAGIAGGGSGGSGGSGGGLGGGTSDPEAGKLSSNGLLLDFNTLAAFDPARPLAHWDATTSTVADVAGDAAAALAPVLSRSDGLEHLSYLSLCALDRGTELAVTDPSDGSTVRFPGLYGLAPGWVDGTCGETCQRWVSACLLAHANAFGDSVMISMRGDNPALVWDDAIETDYPLQEGAFYGNAFAPPDAIGQRPVYACLGRALISFDSAGDAVPTSDNYLTRRICSTGAPCGLIEAGPCHLDAAAGSSCGADAGQKGFYGDCRGAPAGDLSSTAIVYPEVVTTYLANQ